jgi:hypothetical protein
MRALADELPRDLDGHGPNGGHGIRLPACQHGVVDFQNDRPVIADLEPARLVGMLVARRGQVASILQKKVFRPSGRHRIRTCDLYGVNVAL